MPAAYVVASSWIGRSSEAETWYHQGMRKLILPLLVASLLNLPLSVYAERLCVTGFNLESGDSDTRPLTQLVHRHSDCDLWGFSEVQNDDVARDLEKAIELARNSNFERIMGTTGGTDKLAIIYDANRLEQIGQTIELNNLAFGGRAPLAARFQLQPSGPTFVFMVNHLHRRSAQKRRDQSDGINEWVVAQLFPVIAVGDYNYDWNIPTGHKRDAGFDVLLARGVFSWVIPSNLVRTQCSEPLKRQFNSVLDFVFVTRDAKDWARGSEILEAQADYCPDDAQTSDHRPVRAIFEL